MVSNLNTSINVKLIGSHQNSKTVHFKPIILSLVALETESIIMPQANL